MGKKYNFIKRNGKRASQSTRSIQRTPENTTKNRGQQKYNPPKPEPNQSTKTTVERGTRYNLHHIHRLQRKEDLSP